jgi:hypothetical protein
MKRKLRTDSNVFAEVGTVKAALLWRLEVAGYFSVKGTPTREVEADGYSGMTVKECREHVAEVERLAAMYRRTPPQTMNDAANGGFTIEAMASRRVVHCMAMAEGLALLRENGGLKREFVIPFTARYAWARPRLLKHGERREF